MPSQATEPFESMIRNADALIELGYASLTADQARILWQKVVTVLEETVGNQVAARFNDQEMEQFEEAVDANDERQSLAMMQSLAPDYRNVVKHQHHLILTTLRSVAESRRSDSRLA